MADNYLENKMEEHRRGIVAGYRPRRTPSGQRPGTAVLPFPVRDVAVDCGASVGTVAEAMVRAFANTGCHVAVECADTKAATLLAQKCGARAASAPEADIRVVVHADTEIILRTETAVRRIVDAGADGFAARTAELAIYLTLPWSSIIDKETFEI